MLRGCLGFAMHQVRRRLDAVSGSDLADAEIFHSPFYPLPASTRKQRHLRRFLTIYDLIPMLRPELFERNVVKLMQEVLASLTPEDWVVCISEATRRDLLTFCTRLNPDHVRVTHLAAANHFQPDLRADAWPALKRKYNLPDQPYALTLSTLEPRKNIAHVIRCYAQSVASHQVGDMRLVMVGTKGWRMESIFAELEKLGHLSDRVIVTGFVADEDLAPIVFARLHVRLPVAAGRIRIAAPRSHAVWCSRDHLEYIVPARSGGGRGYHGRPDGYGCLVPGHGHAFPGS